MRAVELVKPEPARAKGQLVAHECLTTHPRQSYRRRNPSGSVPLNRHDVSKVDKAAGNIYRKDGKMKFIVDLSLDGYESEEEEKNACMVFIEESLDFSASSVSVESYNPGRLASLEKVAEQMAKVIILVDGKTPFGYLEHDKALKALAAYEAYRKDTG